MMSLRAAAALVVGSRAARAAGGGDVEGGVALRAAESARRACPGAEP